LLAPIGTSWRNSAIFSRTFGRVLTLPQKRERHHRTRLMTLESRHAVRVHRWRSTYRRDITAMVVIDFATSHVELKPGDELEHLWRWHAAQAARPSSSA
jgi:hypothetical protein